MSSFDGIGRDRRPTRGTTGPPSLRNSTPGSSPYLETVRDRCAVRLRPASPQCRTGYLSNYYRLFVEYRPTPDLFQNHIINIDFRQRVVRQPLPPPCSRHHILCHAPRYRKGHFAVEICLTNLPRTSPLVHSFKVGSFPHRYFRCCSGSQPVLLWVDPAINSPVPIPAPLTSIISPTPENLVAPCYAFRTT